MTQIYAKQNLKEKWFYGVNLEFIWMQEDSLYNHFI